MPTGIRNSDHYGFKVTDLTPQSLVIADVTGDPSLGDETPSQRELSDVFARRLHVGTLLGQEKPTTVTLEALACAETDRVVDMCLGRGAIYGPAGTSPLVSVDTATGTPAVKLDILIQPPMGAPKTITWAKAYLTASEASAVDGAKKSLTFNCYGRTET